MRDDLIKMKSNMKMSSVNDVWWKYNWSADYELPEEMVKILSMALDDFLDRIYNDYYKYSEELLLEEFKNEVKLLCCIYSDLLNDGAGLYDYGGLNDFFIDIIEKFPFYKKAKYRGESNMLYDCIEGKVLSFEPEY